MGGKEPADGGLDDTVAGAEGGSRNQEHGGWGGEKGGVLYYMEGYGKNQKGVGKKRKKRGGKRNKNSKSFERKKLGRVFFLAPPKAAPGEGRKKGERDRKN